MGQTEIRIAGFGGQGVVLAGVILGTAAVTYDGKHAVQTQSYGAEARGGAARSEVIISDEHILYPRLRKTDILIAMSTPALDRFLRDLKLNGTLILDSDLVKQSDSSSYKAHKAPFTDTAVKELKRGMVANVVMLGFLTAVTGIVSLGAMERAVRDNAPKGTEALNLNALKLGIQMA
jgi:2-oxoglutarate ferredoxin oxidoreductase subunit gamma